jgi:hypothetical protein
VNSRTHSSLLALDSATLALAQDGAGRIRVSVQPALVPNAVASPTMTTRPHHRMMACRMVTTRRR